VDEMAIETSTEGGWKKEEFLSLCICETCPTYVDCKKQEAKEKAFCFPTNGKSACITKQKGCMCGACRVKLKMKLKHFYFCVLGSEEQQNK
jgi:hypothetical protein